MTCTKIAERRTQFREKYLPRLYSGYLHFAFTVVATIACSFVALNYTSARFSIELVAFFFFLNSYFEYLSHRYHQHKSIPFLRFLYKFHTLEHHQLFNEEKMEVDSHRDFSMVLFPPHVTVGLLTLYFPTLSLFAFLVFDMQVAVNFYLASILSYLTYEFIHFASHHRSDSIYYKTPILNHLCQNHRDHHDPKLMAKKNFGVITTLWDRIFKTKKLAVD